MSIRTKSFVRPRRNLGAAVGLACLATIVAGAVTVAAQTVSSSPTASVHTPAGYSIVTSESVAQGGVTTFGSVACPKVSGVQTKPQSGGVLIDSSSLAVNIADSYPSAGSSWVGAVNNAGGTAADFTVYAVCAAPKPGYAVVSHTVANPAGAQTEATVFCPTGDKVLGGGAFAGSTPLDVNLNESEPFARSSAYGWAVFQNNPSATGEVVRVYAVCSKYTTADGYAIVEGPFSTAAGGAQSSSTVNCPVVAGIQTSVLGGGEGNFSRSRLVNIGSTWPVNKAQWRSLLNNGSANSTSVASFAVCAY